MGRSSERHRGRAGRALAAPPAPDPDAAVRVEASKLANGAALLVDDLTREPARGLLHVLTHVQRSVPGLLEAHQGLRGAAAQLQGALAELQDAQEGVASATGPATRQDLARLCTSMEALDRLAQRQQRRAATAAAGADATAADAAGGAAAAQRWRGS
ncbi:hypothetical protein HT031_006668 [Scenedesmus sp. PABB004]|nr:hypothetical protein HT031_006668 [Scenedesmus sp. PABB004]